MNKYRGSKLIRAGVIGIILCVLTIAVGLQPERLTNLAAASRHQALFTEAGGLAVGNGVKIAGIEVGDVSGIVLRQGEVLVTFNVDSSVRLGSETTAHIRTSSLLGERMLTLDPAGTKPLARHVPIPATRTSSPYSITDAVGDLTANATGIDTQSLNQSLEVLATTIDEVAPQLGPTFDGLTRVSQSLTSRNETVAELLKNTADVTRILADRSDQVNTLILNANDLTGVLVERRDVIVSLLADTSALAKHLGGLIAENEQELAPTLEKLNGITSIFEKNRDNIARAIPGLAKYQTGLSELVAGGPYYTGYIANLTQGVFLQPFLDYAFGFRRGVNAGQPPDNAGPRAEIPFPYNGIPQEHP